MGGSSTPTSVPLAPLPDWLHRLMLQGKRDKPNKAKGKEAPGKVTEGRRNSEMFSLAASLRAKGLTVAEITAAMMEANKSRCDPPLSKQEIEAICQSTGRYERGTDALKPPDYSDAGNAAVFSREYRDDLLFTDALGWLHWNGQRWERDDHKATAWALELSEKMLQESSEKNRAALHHLAEATAKHAETGAEEDADALRKRRKRGRWQRKPTSPTQRTAETPSALKVCWNCPNRPLSSKRTSWTQTRLT